MRASESSRELSAGLLSTMVVEHSAIEELTRDVALLKGPVALSLGNDIDDDGSAENRWLLGAVAGD